MLGSSGVHSVVVDVVIIGGCGHVGIPLGLSFARAGKKVVALDTSAERVAQAKAARRGFGPR
jgi:UDP-N-acetyl-D-mannosaminuronic acid dehydrogenase